MSIVQESSNILSKMQVVKRDGRRESVSFDKIIYRIETVCQQMGLTRINPIEIARDTVAGIYDGITTEELDFFASDKCAEKILDDPEYSKLAAGICISNLHKTTSDRFVEVTEQLYNNIDTHGNRNSLITDEYYNIVQKYKDELEDAIDYNRDYYYDFFGVKTMERAYLTRLRNYSTPAERGANHVIGDIERRKKGRIVERPQHLFMRVAIGIHGDNLDLILETYNLLSNRYFTHASPTLFNAGSKRPQMSSCFLLNMEDSINGIYETLSDAAKISKWSGGIGVHTSNIRSKSSMIRGTNGESSGIIPMIQVYNSTARYVNQGGRRNGAIAMYLEPWHADVFNFCELRKNTGREEERARDMFLALWVCDLFMERVLTNGKWSLMCPDECSGLTTTYGQEFNELYMKYENEGRYVKQVLAKELWIHILTCQMETGMPYMLFKDNVNKKSNQKNIGTIQGSNLCAEIVQYTAPDEIATCNLASICLPSFIIKKDGNISYDYEKLRYVSGVVCRNLNKVIDKNFYPVEKARNSNMKHRPTGIGVQGLADVFAIMDIPYDSEEARIINRKIFETIYYGALQMSVELAKVDGPYSTFEGSPFSQGQLQWNLWGLTENDLLMEWDWASLIHDIKTYGVRNSLLTSIMPTASTSQLMGNTEACEPVTTNLYLRSTLAGEYIVVNKHLVEKLISLGLWTKNIRDEFFFDKGSIQRIDEIPQYVKDIYKTAFEMKAKPIVQQAVERGPFIDQSQSMNIFMGVPDSKQLSSSHFYGWKNGVKTGMYYLRTRPAVDAIKFGLDPETEERIRNKREKSGYVIQKTTSMNNDRDAGLSNCEMCSG